MRNTYPGSCRDCGGHVAAEAGFFEKCPRGSWPKWAVRCIRCVVVGKLNRGERVDTLPFAQRHWWNQLPPEEKQAIIQTRGRMKASQTRPEDASEGGSTSRRTAPESPFKGEV